jgi:Tfp pilus assembly PilM family ATPase
MDLSRFNVDDIHELRVQMAERYRSMPPEEASLDFQRQAEAARQAIEEIRQRESEPA